MADVLVTGASGFIGSAVARALLSAGYSVRALVRTSSPRQHLAALSLELQSGDLRDRLSVRQAIANVRYLFHVAADYRLGRRYRAEIFATNVEGTRLLMQEALSAGVERIVYTSSVATLALRPDGTPADESASASQANAIGAYKQSKIGAERLVSAMVAEQALPAVIVNPTAPIGPGDVRPTPTGRIIVEAAKGRIPAFVETGLNLVHVDDVANGHLAALRAGKLGERYILGGQDVYFATMLADIARLVGRSPPRIRLPHWAVLPAAFAAETMARISNREPFATVEGVRMSKHCMFFTSAKAQHELDYRARPYQEGLADALRWFRDNKYLAA
jgi:dihydroflavonol-4-reductase